MPDSIKNQITTDIEKAKEEGKLRSERIREIVKSAVSQATSELKEGSGEIRLIVKEAVTAVIDNLKEKGGEIKEEVTASIEGAIQGVSSSRRQTIVKNHAEVKQLQAQIDAEEIELQEQIDKALTDIEDTGNTTSPHVKSSIEAAINAIKDSEEVALMRKRYAQLQAQLAVIQANLAARYGGHDDEVKKHLDDAKTWYDRAQIQAETVAGNVKQKSSEFETKLGEAGGAIARREQRVKQLLKELWQTVTHMSHDK
jgi:gas vesicle protein